MDTDTEGWVIDLPPLTLPSTLSPEALPWVVAAVLLALILLLRYRPWQGLWRRVNLFRRTEKPLLKLIGWLSVAVSPLWLALIALVFWSIWQLVITFSEAGSVESVRWHVLAIVGLIAALGGLLAVPLLIMNAFHAERRTRASEESYLTDRIAQAVERLGAERIIWRAGIQESEPNLEVRMGALYLLERIARDSPRDHVPITETICAYVRENAAKPHLDTDATREKERAAARRLRIDVEVLNAAERNACVTYAVPRADIQAAATILGRRDLDARMLEKSERYVMDLRGVHLDRIDWSHANLADAILDGASLIGASLCVSDLKGARLKDAALDEADLFKANLTEAWLSGASLRGAWLDWAVLNGAQLSLATFQGANFSAAELSYAAVKSADFSGAKHLEPSQLAQSVGDGSTILPGDVIAPKSAT
ncbi:MAG: pentapeptide repeat-containing protein, partial [Pseudomonadota bacterium]